MARRGKTLSLDLTGLDGPDRPYVLGQGRRRPSRLPQFPPATQWVLGCAAVGLAVGGLMEAASHLPRLG